MCLLSFCRFCTIAAMSFRQHSRVMLRKAVGVSLLLLLVVRQVACYQHWFQAGCDEYLNPRNCDFKRILLPTVDDIERCGAALLPPRTRTLFGVAGRGETYLENQRAFRRIRLLTKVLRGSSWYSLKTSVLGEDIDVPIGFSPVALQKLANPGGEISTVRALKDIRSVMILNCYASTRIEDLARANVFGKAVLWMHTYLFDDRRLTLNLVRRAEASGYKAIVVTVDNAIDSSKVTCNGKETVVIPPGADSVNVPGGWFNHLYEDGTSLNFRDLAWIVTQTSLPIIAKGILRPSDAVEAAFAGVSGILVSNQGGRNLDTEISTIDALPGIVDAVRRLDRPPEVYLDSGVRSGSDVYKALARGARMVFVGRPVIWALAIGGTDGVKLMLNTLRNEFNETMILTGVNSPSNIIPDALI